MPSAISNRCLLLRLEYDYHVSTDHYLSIPWAINHVWLLKYNQLDAVDNDVDCVIVGVLPLLTICLRSTQNDIELLDNCCLTVAFHRRETGKGKLNWVDHFMPRSEWFNAEIQSTQMLGLYPSNLNVEWNLDVKVRLRASNAMA